MLNFNLATMQPIPTVYINIYILMFTVARLVVSFISVGHILLHMVRLNETLHMLFTTKTTIIELLLIKNHGSYSSFTSKYVHFIKNV